MGLIDLCGRHATITGGLGSIGVALAEAFVTAGARVTILDRPEGVAPAGPGWRAGLWSGDLPVLRPWSGVMADGMFARACNLLVPFSNRISRGGFLDEGHDHVVPPSGSGGPCPIHGDSFQRDRAINASGTTSATLIPSDGETGSFRHSAEVVCVVAPQSPDTCLSPADNNTIPLPFGLGVHTWFPREPATHMRFNATGASPEQPDHLSATRAPVPLDDSGPRYELAPQPEGRIDIGFSGWDGIAWIHQDADAMSVHLVAEQLGTALVYAPSGTADHFCFGLVSYPVDAHNLAGQPGLARPPSGASIGVAMTLDRGRLHDKT